MIRTPILLKMMLNIDSLYSHLSSRCRKISLGQKEGSWILLFVIKIVPVFVFVFIKPMPVLWNLLIQHDNILVIIVCGEFCRGPTYLFLFNGVKADGRRGV